MMNVLSVQSLSKMMFLCSVAHLLNVSEQLFDHEMIHQTWPTHPSTFHLLCQTEMDEVEPRVEEYSVTRAFLALITVLIPQFTEITGNGAVGGSVGRQLGPDTKDSALLTSEENAVLQSTSLIAVIKFLTNSVFLKHNMRAYRDPNERVSGLSRKSITYKWHPQRKLIGFSPGFYMKSFTLVH